MKLNFLEELVMVNCTHHAFVLTYIVSNKKNGTSVNKYACNCIWASHQYVRNFFHFSHLNHNFSIFQSHFYKNTQINLFIIHIYSNKIFISLTLSSLSRTQHNPHSHQDRRLWPPITPESQRKPVKKKRETNPVKKNQKNLKIDEMRERELLLGV